MQVGLTEGYVENGEFLMKVSGRRLDQILEKIREDKKMPNVVVRNNYMETIVRRYANHPIVGWAYTDEDGKVYDDMHVAMERGHGGVKATAYLLVDGLVGFFSHEGIDFNAFYETEFKRLEVKIKQDVEFAGPHNIGACITNQAGFDLLYGLQHNARFVSSVQRRMDSSYEAAQGVVRELCVNFMRALPKDMQAEMDGMLPNGWWQDGGVFD